MKTTSIRRWLLFCSVLFAVNTCIQAEESKATLTLTSPMSCQVFQRSKGDTADILIEGTVSAKADVIEAKADLVPGAKRGTSVKWIAVTPQGQIVQGKVSGRLTLLAGGWYQVTVRARLGTRIIAEQTVGKVGVGEVFITAGQSNSANYGNPRQEAHDDRVVYYDGKSFVHAKDPIPGGCGDGGSPWALLGDRITASQQVPVCFRSASLTWTEVSNWLPGTALYKNLLACVKVFGKDGVRAVLWHQGESDTLVKTSAETYYDRMKTIVETLNKDSGYEIPWFVAQASFHPGSQAREQAQVAKGQQLLWARKICGQGPVTDDLLGPEYRHDGVHFNQKGLAQHAARWFDALSTTFNAPRVGSAFAATEPTWIDAYNVVWDSQSADARGSMPIGGGNLGLNIWVEKDELFIYFGSPDSWSYRGKGFNTQMQTKLGRLRLKFTPVA